MKSHPKVIFFHEELNVLRTASSPVTVPHGRWRPCQVQVQAVILLGWVREGKKNPCKVFSPPHNTIWLDDLPDWYFWICWGFMCADWCLSNRAKPKGSVVFQYWYRKNQTAICKHNVTQHNNYVWPFKHPSYFLGASCLVPGYLGDGGGADWVEMSSRNTLYPSIIAAVIEELEKCDPLSGS